MAQPKYPENLVQFQQQFPDEQACREYLFKLKWPSGYRCGKCGHDHGYQLKTRPLIECASCSHQDSLISGTVMENSKKPLLYWFLAIFLLMSSKGGISAKELQRKLGLGSYQTAWAWLHKLRRLVSQRDKDQLVGLVEVDETYIGGEREGERGRQREGKALVCVAVENRGSKMGRVRLEVVEDAGGKSLKDFVNRKVKPGSMIHTDGWQGYNGLSKAGFTHWREVISTSEKKASEVFRHLHLVVSLLKRWLLGTHQGGTSQRHLQLYLDEFVFRFNRRWAKFEGYNFFRLLEQGAKIRATPYHAIVNGFENAA